MAAVRLSLVEPDLALLDTALDDEAALGRALGCQVADGWAVFPEALRATRDAVAREPERMAWAGVESLPSQARKENHSHGNERTGDL